MDRRQFLRGGAITGIAGLTGIAAYRVATDGSSTDRPPAGETENETDGRRPETEQPPTAEETATPERTVRHQADYGTVVDAVAAGADPNGNTPIGDLLQRVAGDDTLVSFRPGTYRLPQVELDGFDHLAIAAAEDERPTFLAPAGSCTDGAPYVQFGKVTDFLLDGIDFDFRQSGAGGAINVIAAGDATVRDVSTQGSCRSQIAMFRMDVRNADGVGVVERLQLDNRQDTGWLTGAYVGKHHAGEVTFKNCDLRGFTDNGLYGSAPGTADGAGGVVHSIDCNLENNNVSNIRLGTAGSSARGDTVVVESTPEADSINLRGIRLRRGSDQVVDNVDIRFGSAITNSFGALVFHADNGAARVANTTITMDSDAIPAVKAFYHSGSPGGPTFENLRVDGGANRGYAVQLNGRDGTVFRNCTIEQSGEQRDGIRLAYSDDCELVDCTVDVTGYPLILRDTTATIRNTTFVTSDGERHVDHMEAGPGDFRPESWT